ncbi:hypothetical protein GCM10022212_01360 [Actimicrobium antarcticum]|uniref:Tetratricopeptide repeat protein n=1 Tax=Actimicrobium antarcticum TaxID=1051899 RepID=A0ABP7SHE8_9BURK
MLKRGEAALALGKTDDAAQAFERAALILHASDAEMGLVRTTMQAGEYRRALVFAAHTAGAHLDEPEGAALYAWLLHLGGQRAIAARLLAETDAPVTRNPVVEATRRQLRAALPIASSQLMAPPTRFAPYASAPNLPATARVVGSGVLIDQGTRALVPMSAVPRSARVWLRNGVGITTRATVERYNAAEGVAILRLASPLSRNTELAIAPKDPFPGSVAYTAEYSPSGNANPAWPVMHVGFSGATMGNGVQRHLGFDLPPGPRGGPVFDAAGRFIGIAIRGSGSQDQLVTASRLQQGAGTRLGRVNPAPPSPSMAIDQVYESALQLTVQVIVSAK